MKNWKHFTVVAIVAIIALVFAVTVLSLTGCDNPSGSQTKTYTVTFDADNGTANTTQTVTEGGMANKPADPSKITDVAGLYVGTPPDYTFVEWQKSDGSAWNFTTDTVTADITLKAKWTSPNPIDISDETGNNIVEKAVSYVNTNSGSEYTLLLGESVSDVAPQTLNQNDTTLTITSDGNTERKISLGSTNGKLFTVGGTLNNAHSAKLVIDGYVTLVGKSDNNAPLVFVVWGGSLDLKGYSKITGNTFTNPVGSNDGGGGLNAYGSTSNSDVTITMSENAEISGNSVINSPGGTNGAIGGGVLLRSAIFTMSDNSSIKNNIADRNGGGITVGLQGSFYMNGGEISDNTANISGGGVYIGDFPTGGTFTVASEQVKAGIHSNTAPTNPQVNKGTATFTVGGEPAVSF